MPRLAEHGPHGDSQCSVCGCREGLEAALDTHPVVSHLEAERGDSWQTDDLTAAYFWRDGPTTEEMLAAVSDILGMAPEVFWSRLPGGRFRGEGLDIVLHHNFAYRTQLKAYARAVLSELAAGEDAALIHHLQCHLCETADTFESTRAEETFVELFTDRGGVNSDNWSSQLWEAHAHLFDGLADLVNTACRLAGEQLPASAPPAVCEGCGTDWVVGVFPFEVDIPAPCEEMTLEANALAVAPLATWCFLHSHRAPQPWQLRPGLTLVRTRGKNHFAASKRHGMEWWLAGEGALLCGSGPNGPVRGIPNQNRTHLARWVVAVEQLGDCAICDECLQDWSWTKVERAYGRWVTTTRRWHAGFFGGPLSLEPWTPPLGRTTRKLGTRSA